MEFKESAIDNTINEWLGFQLLKEKELAETNPSTSNTDQNPVADVFKYNLYPDDVLLYCFV